MAAGVARNADAADAGLRNGLRRAGFCGARLGERRRRASFVRHIRHEGAEAGQNRGNDHDVTHDATYSFADDPRSHHTRAKPRLSDGGRGCHFDEKDEGKVNGRACHAREGGHPVRREPLGSITSASGILDHPLSRGDDSLGAFPSRPPRLHPPCRHRACGIFRPGMPRIAPAQIGAHGRITAAPKARQIACHLHRAMRRRQ